MNLKKFMETNIYKSADFIEYIGIDGMEIDYENCLLDSKVINHNWSNGHLEIQIDTNRYTWKDVVSINGKLLVEEFPISGEMDGEYYRIEDFLESVAEKYSVNIDDINTYTMDDVDFNPKELKIGAEDCGCYINGVAEWKIESGI